ncbi:MAG: hypothetical protein ACR2IF_08450 [Terriglobales bacterium]
MQSEERQKLVALITAVLLAPHFEPGVAKQEDSLDQDPRIRGAMRTARAICDAVEDLERRSDAVVFEPPQPDNVLSMPKRQQPKSRFGGQE